MTVSEVDTVTETGHREFGAALGYIYRLDYKNKVSLYTGSNYIALASPELSVLLFQTPACWGYRCVPSSRTPVSHNNTFPSVHAGSIPR